MKSRLDALLRQRELLRQHAQWLEEEIAAERERATAGVGTPISTSPVATTATPSPSATLASASAASLDVGSAQTAVAALPVEADVKSLHNEVRRGCLLYLILAFAALGGLLAFVYWKYDSPEEEFLAPEATPAPSPTTPP